MAESFQNLDNILRNWEKNKVQKCIVEAMNRYEKQEEERTSRLFFKKMTQKKYSSGLRRQSSETKINTEIAQALSRI